ncbi:hypothetical protein PGT21_013035 [Puccinia graminis f. sp. tritici]|uniref:GH18 domain-containing protein n=1 Tax=Puccinia graminis f. sp. tritici TaxID=56615 RepID=A0A5B0NDV0_PUCGR|nr:hypothetical protein PGT21_013035 [Puccinia graminis f. sp. tritici]
MRLPRLLSSSLYVIYGSSYLGGSQTSETSSTETVGRRTTPATAHHTLKSFVSRRVDLRQEYPLRMCMRPTEGNEAEGGGGGGHQRRELAAVSYPFTFSNLVSPRARLGQLIVNPSPYLEPAPNVLLPLGPKNSPNANRQSQLLPQQQTLPLPLPLPQPALVPAPSLSVGSPPLLDVSLPAAPPGPITISYFPDWSLDILAPEQVQYKKFDIIYFAFAIPNENVGVDFTQPDSKQTLDRLVSGAHAAGSRVVLSVGGWGGSKFFSVAVKSECSRQTFVNNLYQLVLAHDLDGIDIDWEYPGQAQIQDNIASSTDSAALLSFFQLLRAKLGPHKIISAAVTDYTFTNAQGGRMTNVEEFGKVLDYILIMNYDVWGASSNPGPNGPFSNGCQDSSQPGANMVSSIKTWTSAGFPRQKILMGLAAYGYINHASTTTLVHRKRSEIPQPARRIDQYLVQADNRQLRNRQNSCLDPTGVTCSILNAPPVPLNIVQIPSLNLVPQSLVQTPSASLNQTSSLPSTVQDVLPSTNQTVTASPNLTQTVDPPNVSNLTQTVDPNVSNLTQTVDPNLTATTGPTLFDAGQNDTSGLLRKASSAIGSGDLDGHSGNQIQFTDLFKWGIVQLDLSDNEGRLTGINGYQVAWDRCSSTPYAFSKARNIVITYDDTISIGIKASYALAAGIGGVGFWDMTGDHHAMLIDSARKNLAMVD